MSEETLIERFQQAFSDLHPGADMGLSKIYAPEIVFDDPAHHVEGLDSLKLYFEQLDAGLLSGRFEFDAALATELGAALPWRMVLALRCPKLVIEVDGISHLSFGHGLVTRQRDYFELGQLLYEQVPILGAVVRSIRRWFAAA